MRAVTTAIGRSARQDALLRLLGRNAVTPPPTTRATSGATWDLWGNRTDIPPPPSVLEAADADVHAWNPAAAHRAHQERKAKPHLSRRPLTPATPHLPRHPTVPASQRDSPGRAAGGTPLPRGQHGGRVVLNHSTHLPGLVDVLRRLVAIAPPPGIKSAVPGRIATAAAVSEALALRVTVPLGVGSGGGGGGGSGWRLVARRGRGVQEVFLVTRLSREQAEDAVGRALAES